MSKIHIAILFIVLIFISLLAILTKGQPLLVRKKIMLGLLLMSLTAPAATIVSCKSGSLFQDDIWEKQGWIDDDTYRIKAAGTPKRSFTGVLQLKESAKAAAVLMAQYEIIRNFKPHLNESCAGINSYESPRFALSKDIEKIIKDGKIVAEKYDKEYNCEIIYEARAKDFKKLVESQSNY